MARATSVQVKQQVGTPLIVAPVQDREVISDCSVLADWTINGNDTVNLALAHNHILGTHSLHFDKVDGLANTVFAGAYISPNLDLSRFLSSDGIEMAYLIPALANVVAVHLRIGTSAVNYVQYTQLVAAMAPAVWNIWTPDIHEVAAQAGTGADMGNIIYAAFLVEFALETDALADMLLDHIVVRN